MKDIGTGLVIGLALGQAMSQPDVPMTAVDWFTLGALVLLVGAVAVSIIRAVKP